MAHPAQQLGIRMALIPMAHIVQQLGIKTFNHMAHLAQQLARAQVGVAQQAPSGGAEQAGARAAPEHVPAARQAGELGALQAPDSAPIGHLLVNTVLGEPGHNTLT